MALTVLGFRVGRLKLCISCLGLKVYGGWRRMVAESRHNPAFQVRRV